MAKDPNPTQTIEITNFQGRLTRILNGELNSGFAKFTTSYGYDPFSKPMNLTWLENPTQLYQSNNSGPINDLVLAGKIRWLGETVLSLYAIGSKGNLYKIGINSSSNAQTGSVIGISSVKAGGATYVKGASIDFFGSAEKIYVGNDIQVNSINFDGTAEVVVGNVANYAQNVFRPLKQFAGKEIFGNGPTIGVIDATGTVTSSVIGVSSTVGNIYSELNPALGSEARVRDLDVSPDNNYALITASDLDYENISTATNTPNIVDTVPSQGVVNYWNGFDPTVTSATTLPTNFISALQTYLQKNFFFSADTFGAALNDGTNKLLSLPNNKSPLPNSTGVNGNFLYWIAPEKASFAGIPTLFASLYYYGTLDQENPPGLYRLCRLSPLNGGAGGNIVQTPFNSLVSLSYSDVNSSQTSVIGAGTGQHYFSTFETTPTSSVSSLYRFNVPPTGTAVPQVGVYETQTQLFSKKISIKQIRVYTEPTVVGNSFVLNLIGNDGNTITNGQFRYDYVAGNDVTQLQGNLDRINFNPNTITTYALGIQIVNFGSVNMTIKKIEVDWSFSGK